MCSHCGEAPIHSGECDNGNSDATHPHHPGQATGAAAAGADDDDEDAAGGIGQHCSSGECCRSVDSDDECTHSCASDSSSDSLDCCFIDDHADYVSLYGFTFYRDFDDEKKLSYCVFCGICYDNVQLFPAQLIPRAESERLELTIDWLLLDRLGGAFESTFNAVTACGPCHALFNGGLLWLEDAQAESDPSLGVAASTPSAAAAPQTAAVAGTKSPPWPYPTSLVMRVDPSLKSDHSQSLIGRRLRLPSSSRAGRAFPSIEQWRWHARWAPLKRRHELAKQSKLDRLLQSYGLMPREDKR